MHPVNSSRPTRRLLAHRLAQGLTVFALALAVTALVTTAHAATPQDAVFEMVSEAHAWRQLPPCEEGRDAPLPYWARTTVRTMPHLTAALLELDGTYRLNRELEPRLAALLRLVAARANKSEYGIAYAVADLRSAGASVDEIASAGLDNRSFPAAEQAALVFAHKMTLAAHSVTDEEVAILVDAYGEREVVAMVLQLAYANFFQRLVLTLGTPVESEGPLPPRRFHFPVLLQADQIPAAERPEFQASADDARFDLQSLLSSNDWQPASFDSLQSRMDRQRARQGRVSVPTWEQTRERLPEGMYPKDRPMKIRWSLVVLGHQPELGAAWLRCLRIFGKETQLDRVFAESIFWVVTRSLQCFY